MPESKEQAQAQKQQQTKSRKPEGSERVLQHAAPSVHARFVQPVVIKQGSVFLLCTDDGDIRGGRLTDFTVGLNWYMTPYLRITSNYIRAMLNNPVHGRSNADVFAVRVGYDF